MYPYTLFYIKEFTRGALAGLTYHDTLGLTSPDDASEIIGRLTRNFWEGELDYFVTFWIVKPTRAEAKALWSSLEPDDTTHPARHLNRLYS